VALAHTPPSETKAAAETTSGLPEWTWKVDPSVPPTARLDDLFPRDCPLPSVVERIYDGDTLSRLGVGGFLGKGLKLTVLEQKPSAESEFIRSLPLGNPLARGSLAEGTLERAVTVTLRFTATESGLVNIDTVKFMTGKQAQAEKDEKSSFVVRNAGRIAMVIFLLLCVGAVSWMVLSDMWEQASIDAKRFDARKAMLIEYYEKHNPSKIDSIDDALRAHYGQESKLWRKLENKYGVRPDRPNFLKHGVSRSQSKRNEL
jgi:hypothetical protein